MTLFDTLFEYPAVRQRHYSAPLCKERLEYLHYVKALGRQEKTIRLVASYLLHVNRVLEFSNGMRRITTDELEKAARRWDAYSGPYNGTLRTKLPGQKGFKRFMDTARGWLRFHSCLIEPLRVRFADHQLREYERWLKDERGLASPTIKHRSQQASHFLRWLAEYRLPLNALCPSHLQRYLEAKKVAGWSSSTLIGAAKALEVYLKYSEVRGLVGAGLSETVPRFCRTKPAFKERGPSWKGVRRMISSLSGPTPIDVRDRAMVLLMAIYGLRSGEIRALRITDLDFRNRILTVQREKNYDVQRFPLTSEVSSAIRRYIDPVRPTSDSTVLFLTALRPYRPISATELYCRVSDLFRRNGVESCQKGPHALRHACANQLMDKGFSFRDIGLFLGHRSIMSARSYASYNGKHLRQIAEFSLEGLL